jgi:hypothetical protein
MSDAVVLEYKRVSGDLSTGRVYLLCGQVIADEVKFEDLEFRKMLQLFASHLRDFKGVDAVWQRVDRPGLVPYLLDAEVTRLFREDPVAAIASMCPPPQSPSTAAALVRTTRDAEEGKQVSVAVRAGYDVLASAFGDELAVRSRARQNGLIYVECPCCGIWTPIRLTGNDPTIGVSQCMNTRCRVFDKPLALRSPNGKWALYRTTDLLGTASSRFYLPRTWNDGRSWVTWANLNEKYNEFEKEKETWSCRMHPV